MEALLQQFGWYILLVQNLQRFATIDPELTASLCLQIIKGRQPNSLVMQKVLHLLMQLRNKLLQIGCSDSNVEAQIDLIILALNQPLETAVAQLTNLFHTVNNQCIRSLILLALGEAGSALAIPPILMAVIQDTTSNYPREVKWATADGTAKLF